MFSKECNRLETYIDVCYTTKIKKLNWSNNNTIGLLYISHNRPKNLWLGFRVQLAGRQLYIVV